MVIYSKNKICYRQKGVLHNFVCSTVNTVALLEYPTNSVRPIFQFLVLHDYNAIN
jgi:hypothetical protein